MRRIAFLLFWIVGISGLMARELPRTEPAQKPTGGTNPTIETQGGVPVQRAEAVKPPLNPNFKVTKVHEVRTTSGIKTAGNKSLEFEQKYWTYGAISAEEQRNARGQIYVISWVNTGAPTDVEARLEYRQVNTRDVVRTLTLAHPGAKGAVRSSFSIVGDAYEKGGPIQSWRFSLWRGEELLSESKSFIW